MPSGWETTIVMRADDNSEFDVTNPSEGVWTITYTGNALTQNPRVHDVSSPHPFDDAP